MKKSTDELLKILKSKNSFNDYAAENSESFINTTLPEMLKTIMSAKHISKAAVIKNSNIEKHYAYQIFQGKRIPSRDKMIMLCIGCQANCEQTRQLLLKIKAAPLYSKDKRDSILLFGLFHHMSVVKINLLLDEHGFNILE